MSSSRVPDAEAEWLAEAFRTRYFGFRVKHFREQIVVAPACSRDAYHGPVA